ncbi:phospholipase D-like domain-containing protein [Clostridium ljungdahlii]|uniref:phospholipase D-like domain-containing protein n=1 Tax=Clostridium ljungdahlii TaxID=1538 RepID=UPI0038633173
MIGIKRNFNKINKIELDKDVFPKEDQDMLSSFKNENKMRYNETRLIKNISDYGCYINTKVDYFSSGEDMYKKLLEELKNAKKFIFLEYFIISKSKMWDEIFEILKEKANNGVEVRVLVDYVGSLVVLPKNFKRSLKVNNIKLKIFNPFKIILNFMLNYRDHRKITVIDGTVAFTGGINIGDEYINEYKKYGYWKDMAVCLKGEAVYSFTIMFLRMWQSISKRKRTFQNIRLHSN